MNFIVTFSSLKCEKKENNRILFRVAKVKLQKNSYNCLIKIVCLHSGLSLRPKVNKDGKKEKFTL